VPKVSIIIPTLHLKRPRNLKYFMFRRYTLPEVLDDLRSHVDIAIEVIVVCNGTESDLVDCVKSHPRIDKYCLNKVNVGVSRGWNMGAMMAEGDTLLFLNDDVEVGTDAIEALYDVLTKDPTIGEVGPRGSLWKGAQHDRYVGEDHPEDADNISGFCFMVRTETFSRVGGFDIAYTPAGFEEIDFSFAIRKLGLRCRVVPGLRITHHFRHGVSAGPRDIPYLFKNINTTDLHERNKAYFKRKWNIAE